MRQLRNGLDDSGFVRAYLISAIFLFALFTPSTAVGGSNVQNTEHAPSIVTHKDITTEPPKQVAVIQPRSNDYGIVNYSRSVLRSLNDYEPDDFVLLSTIHGTLSSRDRKTGKERWTIHTVDGAVETIDHRKNSSNEDGIVTWLIEPSEHGQLYYYTIEDGLKKVGLTVKEIIQETPYMPPGHDLMYNGAKNTTTYAINARTGAIQRVFSTGGAGHINDKKCKTTMRISDFDGECDSSEDTDKIIMLGRTEYTITIQRWSTAEMLWTMKFNEWSPNNSDQDLRAQYQRPLDNRYIYSQHDGTIFGFDDSGSSGAKPPKYHAMLDSPVVRIFDVIRSKADSDDLHVLPQPQMRSPSDEETADLGDLSFVGRAENGGWYALSELNFPYVTRQASNANCYEKPGPWKLLPASEREKALIGIHKVRYRPGPEPVRASLPVPTDYENASGYKTNVNHESPPASQAALSMGVTVSGTLDGNNYAMPFAILMGLLWVFTIGTFAHKKWGSSFNINFNVKGFGFSDIPDVVGKFLPNDFGKETLKTPGLDLPGLPPMKSAAPTVEDTLDEKKPLAAYVDEASLEVPKPEEEEQKPETMLLEVPVLKEEKEEPLIEVVEFKIKPETEEIETPKVEITEPKLDLVETEPEVKELVKEVEPPILSEEPITVVTASPVVRFEEPKVVKVDTPTADGEPVDPDVLTPAPKKKKYARGRRGGKKKSKDGNAANGENAVPNGTFSPEPAIPTAPSRDPSALDLTQLATPVVAHVSVDQNDDRGALTVGGLTIYQNQKDLLGSGSQGTTVHKGDFEGRSVAVKRILRTHADIAMKEVKTLQDTDYHQNIVRYYCQQVYGQFLYIALERCPGSLYDVITLPRHSGLRAKMDPRETLLQIAKGLHHLHTLKIVHRDVKPQNILVGEPKTAHQHPRLLISDFGLCKKLQADEYSFGATTAHGAGTIGWRAPELLGDVAREPGERDNSGSGTGTGSDVAVEDPITKRRATRAIDIFALGCVYYFVLTGGDHPFGNRYAREYNIMKGMSEEKTLHDKYFTGLEAVDLVGNMIRANPKQRPDTTRICAHPFFWDAEKKLEFLGLVSDRFESEKEKLKSQPGFTSQAMDILQAGEKAVVKENWIDKLDPHARSDLVVNKRRGYDGTRLLDLLRVIRNKRNHYLDLSDDVRQAFGEMPNGFFHYFSSRFPELLMYAHTITIEAGFSNELRFQKFYGAQW